MKAQILLQRESAYLYKVLLARFLATSNKLFYAHIRCCSHRRRDQKEGRQQVKERVLKSFLDI